MSISEWRISLVDTQITPSNCI